MQIIILAIACMFLTGCSPFLAISGLVGTSVFLGYQHSKAGGIRHTVQDFFKESEVIGAWKNAKIDQPFLKAYSIKGIVVLVGAVTSKEKLEEIKAITSSHTENLHCIVRTTITGGWNNDLVFSLKMKLISNTKISARNYHIDAMQNHIWLVGIAQTQEEKNEVIKQLELFDGIVSFEHFIVVSPDTLSNGYVIHEG